MIATILDAPEAVWSAGTAVASGLALFALKVVRLETRLDALEDDQKEHRGEVKEDLQYLRKRLDTLADFLMENK